MTGTIYDHLTAVIITGALFVAAVVAVPTLSYVNLLYVDQQQLRNVALETLKTMLLDSGYPLNWGSDGNVERFGLALSDSSSSYVLDPDKVQRLVENNPLGFIDYETARQLMELGDYGFSLTISPPFNVTVKSLTAGSNITYEITVTFDGRQPVPNAVVNALILYSVYKGESGTDEKYSIGWAQVPGTTDELGKCTIRHTLPGASVSDYVIVFQTTVGDVATVTTVYGKPQPENIGAINIVGDEIVVSHPKSDPNDARHVVNIAMFAEDGIMTFYNSTGGAEDILQYGDEKKDPWRRTFFGLQSMDPLLIIFNIRAVEKGEGKKGTLIVGPYPNYVGSRVIHYGGSPTGSSVKLQRSVNISGMTYIMELTLWKEM